MNDSEIAAALAPHSSFTYEGTRGDGEHVVACWCHNPDENGDGRADFSGRDLEDALDSWHDHVLDAIAAAAP